MAECNLCKELATGTHVIIETRYVFSLVNLRPLKEGHIMVLPKRHVESFDALTKEEAKEIFEVIEEHSEILKHEFGHYPFITINPHHMRSERHIHIHMVPSFNGTRELFAIAEGAPLNEEAPKEVRVRIKERIVKALKKMGK